MDIATLKAELIKLIKIGEDYDEINISKTISINDIKELLLSLGFIETDYDVDGFCRYWYFAKDGYAYELVLLSDADADEYQIYLEEK